MLRTTVCFEGPSFRGREMVNYIKLLWHAGGASLGTRTTHAHARLAARHAPNTQQWPYTHVHTRTRTRTVTCARTHAQPRTHTHSLIPALKGKL